ncbi:hypothetical protein QFC21_001123 [Naganishia friedmannii]|uniref:Uncharacterized protein n=1 Tax=Naganishia friedmannii TaxID=89922 RepID=A0ACC2W7G8_9TREE|nr:hypothetical protein QFC21_001123 [Naganishia friedmannii]
MKKESSGPLWLLLLSSSLLSPVIAITHSYPGENHNNHTIHEYSNDLVSAGNAAPSAAVASPSPTATPYINLVPNTAAGSATTASSVTATIFTAATAFQAPGLNALHDDYSTTDATDSAHAHSPPESYVLSAAAHQVIREAAGVLQDASHPPRAQDDTEHLPDQTPRRLHLHIVSDVDDNDIESNNHLTANGNGSSEHESSEDGHHGFENPKMESKEMRRRLALSSQARPLVSVFARPMNGRLTMDFGVTWLPKNWSPNTDPPLIHHVQEEWKEIIAEGRQRNAVRESQNARLKKINLAANAEFNDLRRRAKLQDAAELDIELRRAALDAEAEYSAQTRQEAESLLENAKETDRRSKKRSRDWTLRTHGKNHRYDTTDPRSIWQHMAWILWADWRSVGRYLRRKISIVAKRIGSQLSQFVCFVIQRANFMLAHLYWLFIERPKHLLRQLVWFCIGNAKRLLLHLLWLVIGRTTLLLYRLFWAAIARSTVLAYELFWVCVGHVKPRLFDVCWRGILDALKRKDETSHTTPSGEFHLPGHLAYSDDTPTDIHERGRSQSPRSASGASQFQTQHQAFVATTLRNRGRYGLASRSPPPAYLARIPARSDSPIRLVAPMITPNREPSVPATPSGSSPVIDVHSASEQVPDPPAQIAQPVDVVADQSYDPAPGPVLHTIISSVTDTPLPLENIQTDAVPEAVPTADSVLRSATNPVETDHINVSVQTVSSTSISVHVQVPVAEEVPTLVERAPSPPTVAAQPPRSVVTFGNEAVLASPDVSSRPVQPAPPSRQINASVRGVSFSPKVSVRIIPRKEKEPAPAPVKEAPPPPVPVVVNRVAVTLAVSVLEVGAASPDVPMETEPTFLKPVMTPKTSAMDVKAVSPAARPVRSTLPVRPSRVVRSTRPVLPTRPARSAYPGLPTPAVPSTRSIQAIPPVETQVAMDIEPEVVIPPVETQVAMDIEPEAVIPPVETQVAMDIEPEAVIPPVETQVAMDIEPEVVIPPVETQVAMDVEPEVVQLGPGLPDQLPVEMEAKVAVISHALSLLVVEDTGMETEIAKVEPENVTMETEDTEVELEDVTMEVEKVATFAPDPSIATLSQMEVDPMPMNTMDPGHAYPINMRPNVPLATTMAVLPEQFTFDASTQALSLVNVPVFKLTAPPTPRAFASVADWNLDSLSSPTPKASTSIMAKPPVFKAPALPPKRIGASGNELPNFTGPRVPKTIRRPCQPAAENTIAAPLPFIDPTLPAIALSSMREELSGLASSMQSNAAVIEAYPPVVEVATVPVNEEDAVINGNIADPFSPLEEPTEAPIRPPGLFILARKVKAAPKRSAAVREIRSAAAIAQAQAPPILTSENLANLALDSPYIREALALTIANYPPPPLTEAFDTNASFTSSVNGQIAASSDEEFRWLMGGESAPRGLLVYPTLANPGGGVVNDPDAPIEFFDLASSGNPVVAHPVVEHPVVENPVIVEPDTNVAPSSEAVTEIHGSDENADGESDSEYQAIAACDALVDYT